MDKIERVIGFYIVVRYNGTHDVGYAVQDMRDPWGEVIATFPNDTAAARARADQFAQYMNRRISYH